MKKNTTGVLADASAKTPFPTAKLEMPLPLLEVILETRAEIEALSAQAGLKIMARLMDQEIAELCGPWGSQKAHRHGSQPGYVVYAGRKVKMAKPRVRAKDGNEVGLRSYQLFQENGRMQKAVARKLLRQVSTRNYRGAIDECLEGYGIQKSSVSRHWKEATAAELAALCQRPVPSDLAAMPSPLTEIDPGLLTESEPPGGRVGSLTRQAVGWSVLRRRLGGRRVETNSPCATSTALSRSDNARGA